MSIEPSAPASFSKLIVYVDGERRPWPSVDGVSRVVLAF